MLGSNWWPRGEVKSQISLNLLFLYQTLCVFSKIEDGKHIERNFHSVAWVMPQGVGLGHAGGGGSKTLVWGFMMAPHRLRVLVWILSVLDCSIPVWHYALFDKSRPSVVTDKSMNFIYSNYLPSKFEFFVYWIRTNGRVHAMPQMKCHTVCLQTL